MDISLRYVTRNDWDMILSLRNEFYEFFYEQKKPLEQNEHYEYMEKQLSNPKFHQWIIMSSNEDVGYARILNNDIGIMVNKKFQNKGIASEALQLVENEAKKLGIKKLIALVKVNNESSKKIFLKNDYVLKMHWLEKQL